MSDQASSARYVQMPIELFDMVADGRLSKNAAWLYAILLTHINRKRRDNKVWPSRKHLARRMKMSETRAVDRYIAELLDAKLIEREHRRSGEVNDTNVYTLRLVAQGGSAQENTTPDNSPADSQGVVHSRTPPSARQSTRGSAQETTGVVHNRTPEPDEVQPQEEEPEGTEPYCPTSGRSAPSGGDEDREDERSRNRRTEDRALFRQILGDRVESAGVDEWQAGVFEADKLYDALRRKGPTPKHHPGAYLASLGEAGLENWLDEQGFEPC